MFLSPVKKVRPLAWLFTPSSPCTTAILVSRLLQSAWRLWWKPLRLLTEQHGDYLSFCSEKEFEASLTREKLPGNVKQRERDWELFEPLPLSRCLWVANAELATSSSERGRCPVKMSAKRATVLGSYLDGDSQLRLAITQDAGDGGIAYRLCSNLNAFSNSAVNLERRVS